MRTPPVAVVLTLLLSLVTIIAASRSDKPRRGKLPQHVWQSNVGIRALNVSTAKSTESITTRVVIVAEGDDARAVRLEIILPVGVGIRSRPDGCQASPSPITSLSARVTCALGDVRGGATRELSITTTSRPASSIPLRFGVFAFSDTPDPQPSNNFAERTVP